MHVDFSFFVGHQKSGHFLFKLFIKSCNLELWLPNPSFQALGAYALFIFLISYGDVLMHQVFLHRPLKNNNFLIKSFIKNCNLELWLSRLTGHQKIHQWSPIYIFGVDAGIIFFIFACNWPWPDSNMTSAVAVPNGVRHSFYETFCKQAFKCPCFAGLFAPR